MRVEVEHPDGSRTIVLEKGDRVRFRKDMFIGTWKVDKAGELGTVIRSDADRKDCKYPSIAFLDVQSDRARTGGYGTTHCAPWDLEFMESVVEHSDKEPSK